MSNIKVNRHDARRIAETITNDQLQEMFAKAKEGIKDWTKVSNVNLGMTKGMAWNILAKNFDVNENHHVMAKTNMVREFGEYISNELKPKKKDKVLHSSPRHQDPVF